MTDVLREIGDEMRREPQYAALIVEPLEVLGVDPFTDSAVMIRARIKTHPIRQWVVGRELNRRIMKRFQALGIEIPFPHRSLYFGEASKPIRVQLDPLPKDALREMVRDILRQDSGTAPGA